ncbi:hypothetical protein PVAND_011372 [Polypedilum vanderplanki]|uniref:Trafficking protein particle complex subunit 8 n=1 Tax=Polypedilum vanderplanki TaxID=319348 RepID=A0A9J6CJ36_POLVA|nr:hypothetical protein PVAND_011372 [Polypedilum vanderplanki]
MINLTNSSANLSSKELIQSIFSSPLIGSTCSQLAEEICHKNNLNFVQLIQPFSKISTEAHFRDSTAGVSVSVRGLRLNICDVDYRPPQTLLARKMLNESVSNNTDYDKTREIKIHNQEPITIPERHLWFEEWREVFFSVQFPSDHEFTRHLLACLIVVSSSDSNPVEQANHLTKKIKMMQNITPPKLPKWISTDDALNCYLMLHDGSLGDISKAQQGFENLKAAFGDNRCFLIQINSLKEPNTSQIDHWIKYMKNYQKNETVESTVDSLPKTPQEITQMPNTIQTEVSIIPKSILNTSPEIFHPLSPLQENMPEILVTQQQQQQTTMTMSSSTNSLNDQMSTINPNVWFNEPTEFNQIHGAWLANSDMDNLKHFVQDFTIRALIPYVERIVGQLNESITNKKSVSKSLLGATKRWFNTNKPGIATQTAVIYTSDSTELQTRKLGDLYFMFGNYNLAFQAYHQAKRDFYADSAWQFYAGSLEMAALAAFMQGTANKKTYDYMEEAITTYLTVCRLPQFATRATILSMECLKNAQLYCDAAKQLTRMTSEDADLRSALLLEQAAYCYLFAQSPFYRKYAFHSVLSGHRYTKAGQRKHAFRMYKQAEQVISNRGWNLAEDHIQYTISKQAIALKKLEEAIECLSHLLRPTSLQSSQQQTGFLREYIATLKTLISQSTSGDLMTISLPCLNQTSVRVLVTSVSPKRTEKEIPASNIDLNNSLEENWMWNKLEEMLAQSASKKQIMMFKPSSLLFSAEIPSIEHPLCIFGEPIQIAFELENPIKPSILFENVTLLWEFKKDSGELFSNRGFFKNGEYSADESVVKCTVIDSIELSEYEKRTIHMTIRTEFIGYLRIIGIVGKISSVQDKIPIWGKLNFEKIPIKSDIIQAKQDYDRKLEIQILPPATALSVRFTELPREVLSGEIFKAKVEIHNSGNYPISDIYIASNCPKELIIKSNNAEELPLSLAKDYRDITNETFNKDKEARRQFVTKIIDSRDNDCQLNPNETKEVIAYIQAPFKKGKKSIKILIYYNVPENYPKIRYRLLRHEIFMNVNDCVTVECVCNIANHLSGEVGLDITAKNLNQTHHLYSINVQLSDFFIYCDTFSLNSDKVYFVNNFLTQEAKEKSELLPNELLSIRCILNKTHNSQIKAGIEEHLKQNISCNHIQTIGELDNIFHLKEVGNFLLRNKAIWLPFSQQNITNDDLNSLLNANNRHMSVCFNWKASINDNGKFLRYAYGQHFVHIDHLFESYFCPSRTREMLSFNLSEEVYSIYECKKYLDKISESFNSDDEWLENKRLMSNRSLLEPFMST